MRNYIKKHTAFLSALVVLFVAFVGVGIYWFNLNYQVSYLQSQAACKVGSFCGGSAAPASTTPGGNFTISCNYGYQGNGIYAHPGTGKCVYKKFDGTSAIFNCTASTTKGTFANSCSLGAESPYSHRTDSINSLMIVSQSSTSTTGTTTPSSLIPSNAIEVKDIDQSSNWKNQHDTGTSGGSTATTNLVSTPSLDGTARKYSVSFTGSGGQRFSDSFGIDSSSTHFVYDVEFYSPNPSAIENLELDINQVTANGDTVIYATQCSGYNDRFQYNISVTGSDGVPHPKWVSSNVECSPSDWSANTWHHIMIGSERSGKTVTFEWVSIDGKVQYLQNAVATPDFPLGWKPIGDLVLNFQLDGKGSGTMTAYADKLNIWRW